jgi:hypothetical protein
MYAVTPGSFEDFIDHVMPVLADRGLAQREYGPGQTLREKLFPDGGPQLPERHPARSHRALFAEGRTAVPVGVLT